MNNNSTPGELIPVSDFMTTSVVTANENQSVRDVCKLMYNRKVGSVVILTNAKGPETNSDKNNGGSHWYSYRKGLRTSNRIF